jgi:selenide,water dikinase
VLDQLPKIEDPRLLVGTGTFDDAGVVALTDDIALVQSVDFFTPVVDDPYDYGRIAAANALSDIYAMGAEPLSALAVCAFPQGTLPLSVLERILAGGLEVMKQAGVVPLGGHTVKGPELTYGLAVTGVVHPQRILSNGGARLGDVLFLTKPLGTGIMATALKREKLAAGERDMVDSMARLNRGGAHAAIAAGAHGLTDITGYGFLGHALEMAGASGVCLEIDAAAMPLLPGALEAARLGMTFGGLEANRAWVGPRSNIDGLDGPTRDLLCDPQTSGGLLVALAEDTAQTFERACAEHDSPCTRVGRVIEGEPGTAVVRGAV